MIKMRNITIDGVTLTYDKDLDYYIEYDKDGSIDGMIDGSFGEDEAIRIFKEGRAEYRLLRKFIDDYGYPVGFEKWCNFSTSNRETLYNKLVMEHCLDCDMFYDCDCSNTDEDRKLCLLEKMEQGDLNVR